jgi:hypothetical protein
MSLATPPSTLNQFDACHGQQAQSLLPKSVPPPDGLERQESKGLEAPFQGALFFSRMALASGVWCVT